MLLLNKLPRRNPDAPRLSPRERYAALKGSAANVIGKLAGFAPPKLPGAGTPSKVLAATLAAHVMAYGYALYIEAYGLPDVAERRQAEEEAFRSLLHSGYPRTRTTRIREAYGTSSAMFSALHCAYIDWRQCRVTSAWATRLREFVHGAK